MGDAWVAWMSVGIAVVMLALECLHLIRELGKAKADLDQARGRIDHQSTIMARVVEQIDRVQIRLTPDDDEEKHWKGFRGPLFREPRIPRTDVEQRNISLIKQLERAKQELVGE